MNRSPNSERRHFPAGVLLVSLLATVVGAAELPSESIGSSLDLGAHRAFVVRFVGGVDPVTSWSSDPSAGRIVKILPHRLAVIEAPADSTQDDGLRRIRALPGVAFVSPNYRTAVASSTTRPNDPLYPYEWNQWATGYDAARPIVPPSPRTRISILDTGVAYLDFHDPRTQREFLRAPDLDRVVFVPGYDFVDNDAYPIDENQHGTHVASLIASTVNNAWGIAGLLDGVAMQPIRVLDKNGSGNLDELVAGLDFAAESGVDVVNLSLTVSGTTDMDVLKDALDRVIASGAVVVAASGNENGEVAWPAAYGPVIAVGAVRFNGCSSTIASAVKGAIYSNWGPRLDLVAPGGDNAMDMDHDGYPDGVLALTFDPADPKTFGFWFGTGTSVSAAHVSAAAVVLRAWGVPAESVGQLLADTAIDLGQPGFDVHYGAGLVDFASAYGRAASGSWRDPVSFDVVVSTHSAGSNRTVADLFVTNHATGIAASGVTVYGHWAIAGKPFDTAVSDSHGNARVAVSSPSASWTTDAAVVGGAGFIGSITPGGRFSKSLKPVSFNSVTPTGNEPGCGGR